MSYMFSLTEFIRLKMNDGQTTDIAMHSRFLDGSITLPHVIHTAAISLLIKDRPNE